MKELRWGNFGSTNNFMVWIELKGQHTKQWIWYNGNKYDDAQIKDDEVIIPSIGIRLEMNRHVVLEAERKIQNVVKNLISYLPGFSKIIPINFLMANEYKWFSTGVLKKKDEIIEKGWSIHEYVDFKKQ